MELVQAVRVAQGTHNEQLAGNINKWIDTFKQTHEIQQIDYLDNGTALILFKPKAINNGK